MVNFKILAGGFTGFIATYVFDSDLSTLSLVKQNPTGNNPSWIAPHATNKTILYAVNENSPVGALQSFTIDAEGGLTLVDEISSQGNAPTFTNPLTTGEITGMNFGSPNASLIATDPNDPTQFIESPAVLFPRPEGASNPHMSLEVNGEVLVPDLGADKIWRVVSDGAPGQFRVAGQIDVDVGTGPRHIAFRDGVLFTLHEKTSTLTAQIIPEGPNGTTNAVLANVSIIPAEVLEGTKFAAAEIFISEPTTEFPEPLIYVSNRNIGTTIDPAGDTIAIFRFNAPAGVAIPTTTASASVAPTGTGAVTGQQSNAAAPGSHLIGKLMYRNVKRMIKRHAVAKRQLGTLESPVPAFPNPPVPASPTPLPSAPGSEPKPVLELLAQVPTGLQQIRSFAIGPVAAAQDTFLIAGANTNGGVAIFKRIDQGRNLELVARNLELGNRTSFVFL